MSAIDLETLTSGILDDESTYLNSLLRAVGADPPVILRDPPEAAIASARLRSLFQYWETLPRGDRLPLTAAIDGLKIGPALGIVMLLEPLAEPFEYRYRLYGSEIALASKLELTGRTTAAIPSAEMRAFFRATYAATIRSGRPLLCSHRPPAGFGITCWCRLILPCEDGSGRIDRLLVGNEPAIPSLVRRRPWPDV